MTIETDKERIRMELFKEVYMLWLPEVKNYGGHIAKEKAEAAVHHFDDKFNHGGYD